MDRTILHCDCNGFYASVECVLNPEYKNVPMAVCGSSENRHGIILAKNELAKKFNIKTAETIWSAKKKCPDLVLAPPHRDVYLEYSKKINKIYADFTDMVEPFGIDESWLDVTASYKLFGDGKTIADELRRRIRETFGLTISVGVSFNKVFAKLGSDYKKPDATTVISRENYKDIVFPLPAEALLYVGSKAASKLNAIGIKTIGDLAKSDAKMLESIFGKTGVMLHEYANGEDNSPVKKYGETDEIKSVGHSITFKRDLVGESDIKTALTVLCDMVASRMRKNGVKGSTLQVGFKDTNLKMITRQKPFKNPTNLAHDMFECAMEIVKSSWNLKTPVRMLSVAVTSLVDEENAGFQMSLFDDEKNAGNKKATDLETSIDKVREKFGKNSIKFGSSVNSDMGLE